MGGNARRASADLQPCGGEMRKVIWLAPGAVTRVKRVAFWLGALSMAGVMIATAALAYLITPVELKYRSARPTALGAPPYVRPPESDVVIPPCKGLGKDCAEVDPNVGPYSVPEPNTLVLVGLSLATLVWRVR